MFGDLPPGNRCELGSNNGLNEWPQMVIRTNWDGAAAPFTFTVTMATDASTPR